MRQFHHVIALLLFLCFSTSKVIAHGGGVDASGCHVNGKTGQHHCHTQNSKKKQPQNRSIIEVPASGATSYMGGNNTLTKKIQLELARLGYFPGNTVGLPDHKTSVAIKHFQEDIGLKPTGARTQELLKLLQIHQANE